MSKQERKMLDDLADREGVKAAHMVRMLVRAAHKAISKDKPRRAESSATRGDGVWPLRERRVSKTKLDMREPD